MNILKKQIDPSNIFFSFLFLGHHSDDSNDLNNCVDRLSFAKSVSASIAGLIECLRLSVIAFTGLWFLFNARTTPQEKFNLSYLEMCSLTVYAIYCYICFVVKIRKKTTQNINSQDLRLLAGQYTAGFLASIYILKKKVFLTDQITIQCSWYTEVLLAVLCQLNLPSLKSIQLVGELGNKEIFQLNQLRKQHPKVKILMNIDNRTICFDEVRDHALKTNAKLLNGIIDKMDFTKNLRILLLMNNSESHEILYHLHLIVLLRIRNPNLSLTVKCSDSNFLSDIKGIGDSIEITQKSELKDFDLVFFRQAANTILAESSFQNFVYFYEPGAFNHNTLNHLGRCSISLNTKDLQAKPISKQSFKLSPT